MKTSYCRTEKNKGSI